MDDRSLLPPPPTAAPHDVHTPSPAPSPSASPAPPPSATSQALFHVGGALITAAAAVGAFVLFLFLNLATSASCGGDTTDPELVNQLRLGTVAIAVGLACVPGLWALLARAGGHLAAPWVAVAGLALAAGLGQAVSMHEVGTWCF
jgi:hypothetical protein